MYTTESKIMLARKYVWSLSTSVELRFLFYKISIFLFDFRLLGTNSIIIFFNMFFGTLYNDLTVWLIQSVEQSLHLICIYMLYLIYHIRVLFSSMMAVLGEVIKLASEVKHQ